MGFFGKILEKLGIGDDDSRAPDPTRPRVIVTPTPQPPRGAVTPTPQPGAGASVAVAPEPPPVAVPVVDVVAKLEERAAANPEKLNWRTSIVDLLKLLEIDSSYAARKELAVELGCPAELMADSAQMNTWLHRAVLGRIAANGGIVPPELLD